MPKMVRLAANPDFKPETDEDKAAYAAAKKKGPFEVAYVTAIENIRNSRGMLHLHYVEPVEAAPPGPRRLEDMDLDELKVMMLSLGIKSEKKMKRDDVVRLIRSKMTEIEIEE